MIIRAPIVSASEGNRTPVTSLGSSGNNHYTTLAAVATQRTMAVAA